MEVAKTSFNILSSIFRLLCADGDPCNNRKNGLSFTGHYQPQPGEMLFTSLLRFTEITQSCIFKAFIPVDSDYRALGLSVYTQCPLLAIGELILPEMSHTLTFIGLENPSCFITNFLGMTDPALVIESELINSRLLLGNILELQTNSRGPDVVTVFGRSGSSGPVSEFSSVRVTLFGGVFESEAVIRSNQLTLSTSSGSVFGFPAQISISAPSNETDWQDLTLTVEGSLLSEAEGSFVDKLTTVVVQKLTWLAEVGHSHQQIVQKSLDRSMERLDFIMNELNKADQHITRIEGQKNSAYEDAETARANLMEIEREAERVGLQDEVDILNGLCTEEPCDCICMPGELCGNCTSPQHLLKCPGGSERTPSFFTSKITCHYEVEYVLEINQTYFDTHCPNDGKSDSCHAFTGNHPILVSNQWRTAEVDVQTSKSCSVELFNSTVPETCCENVTCAMFVADPSCLTNNSVCRSIRESAVESSGSITSERQEFLLQLLQRQSELIAAETAAQKIELESEVYLQRRDELNASVARLKDAHDSALDIYNTTLEKVKPLLRIYESGKENEFRNIFRIKNVTFLIKLTHSPTIIALNISFQKHYFEDCQQTVVYISTHSEELNFERISSDIIQAEFTRKSTETPSRSRRQTRLREPKENSHENSKSTS